MQGGISMTHYLKLDSLKWWGKKICENVGDFIHRELKSILVHYALFNLPLAFN